MMGYYWGQTWWLAQTQNKTLDQASELFQEITTFKVVQALIIILATYWLILSLEKVLNWFSERVALRFRLSIKQSLPFCRTFCLTVAALLLGQLLLNLSPNNVLAITGTTAVALGFAFKDYASSVIAGVIALFERPYQVGDRVQVGEHYGEITNYGLRAIELQTPTDNKVIIPHNKLWTEAIVNGNDGDVEIQVTTNLYFAHQVNLAQITQILYRVAQTSKYTQIKLPIQVVLEEKPWGVHFKLKAYPIDARDEFIYQTDLTRRAREALEKVGANTPPLISSSTALASMEQQVKE